VKGVVWWPTELHFRRLGLADGDVGSGREPGVLTVDGVRSGKRVGNLPVNDSSKEHDEVWVLRGFAC